MDFIEKEVIYLIKDIIQQINIKNVNIYILSNRLLLDPNYLLHSLRNPRRNISYYYEILEELSCF